MIFLTLDEVLVAHEDQVAQFGGEPNIRDMGLLQSALGMPASSFGGQPFHEFPHGMAAAYLFHVCANHPFVDGNKRTALATALIFLDRNQYRLDSPYETVFQLVVDVAAGRTAKDQVIAFFQQHVRQFS